MAATIKSFLSDRKIFLALGFLSCMILWITLLTTQHRMAQKTVSESRGAGLASASVGWDPVSLWNQRSLFAPAELVRTKAAFAPLPEGQRKIARQAHLSVIAKNSGLYHQDSTAMVNELGGYVVHSNQMDPKDASGDSRLQVRVPAQQFDQALTGLQQLALRVESVSTQAADVTKEYVDFESMLRNLRAEEAQYLTILKQARTVQETVLVTEKILSVRGRIEKTQGEFEYLNNTIVLSSITVEVSSEAGTRVAGLHWRPGIAVRQGFQSMLQGMANFADAIIFLLFKVPVAVLWLLVVAGMVMLSGRLLWKFKVVYERKFGGPIETPSRMDP